MGCGSSQVAVTPADPSGQNPGKDLRPAGSYEGGTSKEEQRPVDEYHVKPKIPPVGSGSAGEAGSGVVKPDGQRLPGEIASRLSEEQERPAIKSSTGGSRGTGSQTIASGREPSGSGVAAGTTSGKAAPESGAGEAVAVSNDKKDSEDAPSPAQVGGVTTRGGDAGDAGGDKDGAAAIAASGAGGATGVGEGAGAEEGPAGGEGRDGATDTSTTAVDFKDYGEAELPDFDPQHGTGTAGSVPLQRIHGSIDDRYKLEKILGKGSFGEVWRCYKLSEGTEGQRYAIKKIKPDVRTVAKKAARKVLRASTVARKAMQLANAAATRRASESESGMTEAAKAAALAAVKAGKEEGEAAGGGGGKEETKEEEKEGKDAVGKAVAEGAKPDEAAEGAGEAVAPAALKRGPARKAQPATGPASKLAASKKVVEGSKSNGHHEADIMNRVRGHDSVVEVKDLLEDDMNVYIAMEYCSGGDLMKYVMRSSHFSEKVASFLFRQMLEGIAWCHSRGVVHRDLKPDNFLFASTEGRAHLKIADFGLATTISTPDEIMTDGVGSAFFLAPEVLQRRYTSACDVWSLGVNLYLLLSGTVPFGSSATKAQDVYRSIRNDTLNFSGSAWNRISAPARELVSGLLEKQPYRRYTIAQALNHPWVRSDGVAPDVPLDTNIVTSMRNFNANNKLRREAIRLVSSTLSAEDLQRLRAQFHAIDKNTDLCISVEEMAGALHKMGLGDAASGVKDLMTTIDADGDGLVDLDEFIQATAELQMINHQNNIWWAFCQYDVNGDGVLGLDEVREVLKGENEEKLREYIELNDRDSDGVISYEEFIRMLVPPDMEFQTISFT